MEIVPMVVSDELFAKEVLFKPGELKFVHRKRNKLVEFFENIKRIIMGKKKGCGK